MDVENYVNIMSMQGVLSPLTESMNLKDIVESELKNDPVEFEGKNLFRYKLQLI